MRKGTMYPKYHAPCSTAPTPADTPTRNTTAPAQATPTERLIAFYASIDNRPQYEHNRSR